MASKYYNPLKMLYDRNKISKDGLKEAVVDGRLTPEDYQNITGEAYVTNN